MKHLLIIGAGGVSRVATVKSAMTMAKGEAFSKITLASRTKSKCDEIAAFIKERVGVDIATAEVNADDTAAVAEQSTVIIVFAFIYLASYLNERFTPKVNVLACGKFP